MSFKVGFVGHGIGRRQKDKSGESDSAILFADVSQMYIPQCFVMSELQMQ